MAAEIPEETLDHLLGSQEKEKEKPHPPPTKKRRTVRRKSKEERLAKCPHCLREFTNLHHHINQQHAQVGSWQANTSQMRPDS